MFPVPKVPSTGAATLRRDERGFTLVEVMVVVLIVGVLLAIAVPTFLGARDRAEERAAQSNLRIAQATAMVIFTDDGDFDDVTTGAMRTNEPSLTWIGASSASTSENRISIGDSSDSSEWGAAAMADNGTCYYVRLRESGSTLYGSSTSAACTATVALTQARSAQW